MVQFHETDMAGVVHFSRFFLYMEEAEHALLRSLGISIIMNIDGSTISWPRVHCSFDYKRPLSFEDEIELVIAISKVEAKSVTYSLDVRRDGQIHATGTSIAVCCILEEPGKLKSVLIPEEIRKALGASP